MTIDNSNTATLTPEEEASVRDAANRLIAAASVKGGYAPGEIPEQARQDAHTYARTTFLEDKALKSNPLWPQLEAERAAHEQTRKTLAATQQVRPSPVSNSRDTGLDPTVVRAQMGEGNWRALTDNGRLQACGVNPATVTQVDLTEAKRIFGKGSDTHYAVDLSKSDFARYKHLKRIAVVLNLQGQ